MTIASTLALVVTLVAWVIDMVLFGIAKNRIHSAGGSAMYGNVSLPRCMGVCRDREKQH